MLRCYTDLVSWTRRMDGYGMDEPSSDDWQSGLDTAFREVGLVEREDDAWTWYFRVRVFPNSICLFNIKSLNARPRKIISRWPVAELCRIAADPHVDSDGGDAAVE